ncbi:MAG: PilX N-terminal domain-containing pilus assembly protein, partial [Pseudomonadota bacterium]
MVFSSYDFLLGFLPLTLIGFYALRAAGMRRLSVSFLLLASLAFYGVWSLWHLALLIISIAGNYFCGRYAASSAPDAARKTAMIAGVAANLLLIFWFKYLGFAGSNFAALLGVTFAVLSEQEQRIAVNERDHAQALYIAEAAVCVARTWFQDPSSSNA